MVPLSNKLIGALNLAILLLSLPVLGGGIYLKARAATDCEKFLEAPLIALGVFLFVVSLAGFIGACYRNSCLLWLYTSSCSCSFSSSSASLPSPSSSPTRAPAGPSPTEDSRSTASATSPTGSRRGWRIPRTGGASGVAWSRGRRAGAWSGRTRHGRSSSATISPRSRFLLPQIPSSSLLPLQNPVFFIPATSKSHLFCSVSRINSPQSGCCKPPTACNFTFVNATTWVKPASFHSGDMPDCNAWENDRSTLCYDCESCKAGVLAQIKRDWKKIAAVNVVFLVFLLLVYSVGCCAFRNHRDEYRYPRWIS